MKIIIAGGRNYQFTDSDIDKLNNIKNLITEIVSGGAKGADYEGERWAKLNNIPVKFFKADWSQYGRAAGPIRNKQMAEYADAIILFPGGSGTDNMYANAVKANLKIYDYRDKKNFKEWLSLNEGFGFDWSKLPNSDEFIKLSAKSIDIKSRLKDRSNFLYKKTSQNISLQNIIGRNISRKDFSNLINSIAVANLKRGEITPSSINSAAIELEKYLNSYYKSLQNQYDPNHQENINNIADKISELYHSGESFEEFDMVKELKNLDSLHNLIYFKEKEDLPSDLFRLKPLYKRKKLAIMSNKNQKHGVDVTIYYAFELAPTVNSKNSSILSKMSGEDDDIDKTPYSWENPTGGLSINTHGWQTEWNNISTKIEDNNKKINSLKKQKDPDSQQPYGDIKKYYLNQLALIKANLEKIQDSSYNLNNYFNNYKKISSDQLTIPEFKAILKYIEDIEPEINKLANDNISLSKYREKLRKTPIKPTHANDPTKPMTLKNRRKGNINQFLKNSARVLTNIMKRPENDTQRIWRLHFTEEAAKLYHNANPDKNIDYIIHPESKINKDGSSLLIELKNAFASIYKNAKIIEGFKKLPGDQITMNYDKARNLGNSQEFINNMKAAEERIKRSRSSKSLTRSKQQYRFYANFYYNDLPSNIDLRGKDILVIDDIGTTGSTMQYIKEELVKYNPNSLEFYVPLTSSLWDKK
jgi:hypothetical protein